MWYGLCLFVYNSSNLNNIYIFIYLFMIYLFIYLHFYIYLHDMWYTTCAHMAFMYHGNCVCTHTFMY